MLNSGGPRAEATYIIGKYEIATADIPLVNEIARLPDHGKRCIARSPVAPLEIALSDSRFITFGHRGDEHMQARPVLW